MYDDDDKRIGVCHRTVKVNLKNHFLFLKYIL